MPVLSTARTEDAPTLAASLAVRAALSGAIAAAPPALVAGLAVGIRVSGSLATPEAALAASLRAPASLSAAMQLPAAALVASLTVSGTGTPPWAPETVPLGWYPGQFDEDDAELGDDAPELEAEDGHAMLSRLVTPPAAEPISLADAKTHLRVTSTADDVLIAAYLAAAREQVEALTGRAMMLQTWEVRLSAFWSRRRALTLPLAPLAAVVSVVYVDATGAEVTLSPDTYTVEMPVGPSAPPGSLRMAVGGTVWPTVRARDYAAVRIRYQVGYVSAADVPPGLRAAILLLLGDLYENREASQNRNLQVNPAVEALLGRFRSPRIH